MCVWVYWVVPGEDVEREGKGVFIFLELYNCLAHTKVRVRRRRRRRRRRRKRRVCW